MFVKAETTLSRFGANLFDDKSYNIWTRRDVVGLPSMLRAKLDAQRVVDSTTFDLWIRCTGWAKKNCAKFFLQ